MRFVDEPVIDAFDHDYASVSLAALDPRRVASGFNQPSTSNAERVKILI